MTTPGIRSRLSEKSDLDILAVLRTLKLVVAETGDDFVYQRGPNGQCYYIVNRQPSCIAGKVLHRLGVPIDLLRLWEGTRVTAMGNSLVRDRPAIDFSYESLQVLGEAQVYQDQGKPWGDCRDRALLFAYEKYGVTAS